MRQRDACWVGWVSLTGSLPRLLSCPCGLARLAEVHSVQSWKLRQENHQQSTRGLRYWNRIPASVSWGVALWA